MKNKILCLLALLWLPAAAPAGDIKPGAVPGSINYQGRLERDNAPVTGIIHIFFRIYNASSGGTMRWQSPEIIVTAAQGIFSASITPPWDVFSRNETMYLEVQVESDILTPREPLNSVAYALVAKRLEDGASVSVTTLTAAYQVLLATTPNSLVGIGTNSPDYKLTVNGTIWLHGADGKLCFDTGRCLVDADAATGSGGITAPGNSTMEAGTLGTGYMKFLTTNVERFRVHDTSKNGTIGIGPLAIQAPMPGALDVDGRVYVSTWGVSERSGGPVPVNGNFLVKGGRITGIGQNYLSIGETGDTIIAGTANTQRVWIAPDGKVGIGLSPAELLHSAGDIASNTGVRGSKVSVGAYTAWGSLGNEVRAQNGSHLLLQQSNSFNVGIGTDTPREKLHVHGSVLADNGILASTAGFTGDVGVSGNFTANGNNKQVFLTSTTIYGTLSVTGGVASMAGFPAYIASTQTLTGQNTFTNQVVVSSDIMTPSRMGAAMKDFNFGAGRYLQVGDNKAEYSAQNTVAYLVGGDAANARLAFYRGPVLAGSLETQNGANLATVVGGQTKTLTDSVYHRIQNSVVWISTGVNTTPAIYVSSQQGNVGIGTTVADPTYKLTVNGSVRISGPTSNGIVFADGTTMNSAATIGAAMSIANPGDAVVAANTLGGGGSVVLRSGSLDGLVADSSGRIGIGTLYPVSKLNLRGGDLVLGTPVNPYSGGPENLIVAGNIVFDGALVQRSLSATQLSGLIVAGDVYLSTSPLAKTGIGTNIPGYRLDVSGDMNASGAVRTGGTVRISAAGVVGGGNANATWDGNTIALNRGGTGAGDAPTARTNLGLGSIATQSAGAVAITGGTLSGITSLAMVGDLAMGAHNISNAGTITATSLAGTLTTASQANITTVGTLTGLTLGGDLAMGAHNISNAGTITATSLAGTLTTAAQANITTVGTLTGLTMGGDLAMGTHNITGTGSISATTLNATNLNATNLSAVTMGGNLAMGTYNISNAGTITATSLAGTLTTASQANITTVGTLTGLTMGGNIAMGNNNITGANSISAVTFTGALTGNASGTAANVTGTVAVANGGTNANNAASARTNLGVPANDGTGASGTWGIGVTGNAGTATALAANGGNCTGANFAKGVDASGAAECTASGNASQNHAVCWKGDGSLGYCVAVVDSSGLCGTCN